MSRKLSSLLGCCCLHLNKSGEGVTVVAEVSSEALAEAGVVVALSTTAALEGVEVSNVHVSLISGYDGLVDVRGVGEEVVILVVKTETGQLGCAAIVALVVLNSEVVLAALHGTAGEGDLDQHHISFSRVGGYIHVLEFSGARSRGPGESRGVGARHGHIDTIDNSVG